MKNNNRNRRTVFRSSDFAARLFYVLPTRRQLSAAEKGGFERPERLGAQFKAADCKSVAGGHFFIKPQKKSPHGGQVAVRRFAADILKYNGKRRTVFRSGDFAARLFLFASDPAAILSAAEKGGF